MQGTINLQLKQGLNSTPKATGYEAKEAAVLSAFSVGKEDNKHCPNVMGFNQRHFNHNSSEYYDKQLVVKAESHLSPM